MSEAAKIPPTRKSQRFVPKRPVTVAISKDGQSFSYGVVANISESGACLHTNVVPRHDVLDLLMSFYEGDYVRASGRVVWRHSADGLAKCGVEFTDLTEQALGCLRSNLSGGEFLKT